MNSAPKSNRFIAWFMVLCSKSTTALASFWCFSLLTLTCLTLVCHVFSSSRCMAASVWRAMLTLLLIKQGAKLERKSLLCMEDNEVISDVVAEFIGDETYRILAIKGFSIVHPEVPANGNVTLGMDTPGSALVSFSVKYVRVKLKNDYEMDPGNPKNALDLLMTMEPEFMCISHQQ